MRKLSASEPSDKKSAVRTGSPHAAQAARGWPGSAPPGSTGGGLGRASSARRSRRPGRRAVSSDVEMAHEGGRLPASAACEGPVPVRSPPRRRVTRPGRGVRRRSEPVPLPLSPELAHEASRGTSRSSPRDSSMDRAQSDCRTDTICHRACRGADGELAERGPPPRPSREQRESRAHHHRGDGGDDDRDQHRARTVSDKKRKQAAAGLRC